MNTDKLIFGLAIILILIFFIFKKSNQYGKIFGITGVLLIFSTFLLPEKFFGKWNSINNLENKQINLIILRPSSPGLALNLTNSSFRISNKIQIKYILDHLKSTYLYFPSHKDRIWETYMILRSSLNDSLLIKIEKLSDGRVLINNSNNRYTREGIGNYLESIVKFSSIKFE